MGALGGCCETSRAIVRDDRQSLAGSEVRELALAAVYQRSDHPEVAGIVEVMRPHGVELTGIKGRHEEALCEVIEMLRQRQDVVARIAGDAIHDAALHPRAECAERVLAHVPLGLFEDGLLFVEVGHAEGVHHPLEGGRIEARHHGPNSS